MPRSSRSTGRTLARTLAVALAGLLPLVALAALAATNPRAEGTTGLTHQRKGVGCVDCHGKAAKPAPVAAATCLGCHGPAEVLIAKTAKVKPFNVHDSPHWGGEIDCYVCHRQHEKTVNWCAHCHGFEGKVP